MIFFHYCELGAWLHSWTKTVLSPKEWCHHLWSTSLLWASSSGSIQHYKWFTPFSISGYRSPITRSIIGGLAEDRCGIVSEINNSEIKFSDLEVMENTKLYYVLNNANFFWIQNSAVVLASTVQENTLEMSFGKLLWTIHLETTIQWKQQIQTGSLVTADVLDGNDSIFVSRWLLRIPFYSYASVSY